MRHPRKIFVSVGPITGKIDDTWHDVSWTGEDFVYYSEEAIKEILQKVVADTNHLVDISTTVHKTKLDADKYIPHIMELLQKGDSNA